MHAIILGIGSDIGRELALRLNEAGWRVSGCFHTSALPFEPWDLVVCCYGVLDPIGSFWEQGDAAWEDAIHANALLPLRQVRALYPHRRRWGESVCFFSGAGAGGPAPTYSAYCASKVMLTKMVELLDDESPDCKFFILGPGMVRTKIHEQTMRAGERAANYQRVRDYLISENVGTSYDDIYSCLMTCVAAPKAAVGGRNICVHLDDWSRLGELVASPSMFKLRRAGDASIRRLTP